MWVTLKEFPGEFFEVVDKIAVGLEELVGSDKQNSFFSNQRFCMALQLGEGYRLQVYVKNKHTKVPSIVTLDYGNLPIRCKFCMVLDHLVKNAQLSLRNDKKR